MKPLTIEELKALEIGNWVWVIQDDRGEYMIVDYIDNTEIVFESLGLFPKFSYSSYGKKWIAYKNKEQAEEVEKCVICHKSLLNILPKVDEYGNKYCNGCYEVKCALEILKEKQARGEIVELPCKIGDTVWVVYRDFDYGFNEYKIYETKCIGFVFNNGLEIRILTSFNCYDLDRVGNFTDKSEAERRLAELKGERK